MHHITIVYTDVLYATVERSLTGHVVSSYYTEYKKVQARPQHRTTQ